MMSVALRGQLPHKQVPRHYCGGSLPGLPIGVTWGLYSHKTLIPSFTPRPIKLLSLG